MNATLFFIIYILVLALGLTILIMSIIKNSKASEKHLAETIDIFNNKLYPLCKGAKTLEDCEIANNVLLERCVKDDKFIIHRTYFYEFSNMRFYLLGKIDILKNK